jgi:hypothetical protein
MKIITKTNTGLWRVKTKDGFREFKTLTGAIIFRDKFNGSQKNEEIN